MADETGSVDLGNLSREEKEALGDLQKNPPEDTRTRVLTAFVVTMDHQGNPQVSAMNDDEDIIIENQPTLDLVYAACSTVIKDIAAQEAARATAIHMAAQAQQMQQQMQQQMEAQRIQQMLQQQGGPRG